MELFRARLLDCTDEERSVLLTAAEVLGLDLEYEGKNKSKREVDDNAKDEDDAKSGIDGDGGGDIATMNDSDDCDDNENMVK